MPTAAATVRAPSSSPVASAGETAVTARARSPKTRADTAATSEESTPPENATSALGAVAIAVSSSASVGIFDVQRGGGRGERLSPDLLDGPAGGGRDRGAVIVLGRDVHNTALKQADLGADNVAADVDLADRAIELVAFEPLHAHTERRRVSQERLGESPLPVGAAEDAEHDAGTALLHLDGRRPGVDGAGGRAGLEDVRHQLGDQVVHVGLEEDDRRVPARFGRGVPDHDANDVRPVGMFASADARAGRV